MNQSLINPSLSILLSHDTTSPFSFKDACSAKQTTAHVFFTIVTCFGRKMENAIVIKTDLEIIYQQLIGKSFTATCQGIYPMPQTGNERYILEIEAGSDFAATLKQISSTVLAKYGSMVWKGITGPEDSSGYTNYWLWVEPDFAGNLLEGSTYNIVSANVFLCAAGTFSYGVSLKADVHLV